MYVYTALAMLYRVHHFSFIVFFFVRIYALIHTAYFSFCRQANQFQNSLHRSTEETCSNENKATVTLYLNQNQPLMISKISSIWFKLTKMPNVIEIVESKNYINLFHSMKITMEHRIIEISLLRLCCALIKMNELMSTNTPHSETLLLRRLYFMYAYIV